MLLFDVYPDLFKTRLLYCCRQWRIPPPLRAPPWMTPGDPLSDPVMEISQGLLHTGGQDPRLRPKKQHYLDDFLLKKRDILGSAPYWPRILVVRIQLFQAFLKLPVTVGQLSSPAVITRLRYGCLYFS